MIPSITSQSGGPPRSTLANCQALKMEDPKVHITLAATTPDLHSEWNREYERRMPEGMNLKLFPALGRHAFTYSPQLVAWLWRQVEDYDLVVVRALLHPISSTAAWIARRRDVPYLVVPHGTLSKYTFEHRRTGLKRAYFGLVERFTLQGAAGVRFTAESERGEAPSWGSETPTHVIPHPFESGANEVDARSVTARQVLFLSRLDPKKGLDVLLPAAHRLRKGLSDVHVVLAGSGTETFEAHLREEIDRLDLTKVVQLPGFVEGREKARLLAESSVFVLPSHQENFGMAVVEAMDAGIPVVISRGVGIWREVDEAGAGLVVEREPEAMADALAALLRDPKLRHRMGARGRELVRTSFAPERIGRQLRILYRQAAASTKRKPKEAA